MRRTNLEFKDLEGENFENADLQKAILRYTNLKEAVLTSANLQETILEFASLEGAILTSANLQKAGADFTNMQGISLKDANLQGSWLGSVDLREANLLNTNLKETLLVDSCLRDAKNIESAKFDEKTLLPDAELQCDDDGRLKRSMTSPWFYIYTPESYWKPETDMTRYTNPDHPDFWVPRWAAAGFASAGEWYDTGRKLLPSRMLSGRSYPWRDAGYGNNHMAWFRDGNQDYQAKYIVAGFTVHWKWRKTNYFYHGDSPFAKDLTPWREAGYGNDHMAWLRDGKPDPLTEDDPYYDYRYEWLAAGFAKYYDWMWADYTQPWREAGYGNDHMAWLRDGKPDPLPIEHPNSWRPKWQSAGFSSLIEYVDAERPKPWYEAGYDYDHMAWLRDGKPDKKPNKD